MIRRDHKFAKALRAAMRSARLGIGDVAIAIGVQRSTVQGWLNGSEPGDANFRKLVVLFPELAKFES
jgi:predicted transcriptional regulator